MLAARLKNIFFTLLLTQILGALIAFFLWSAIVFTEGDRLSRSSAVTLTQFYLTCTFFVAVICFLVLFFRRMSHFRDATYSVTVGILAHAEGAIFAVGVVSYLLALVGGTKFTPIVIACFTLTAMTFMFFLHLLASNFLRILYNLRQNRVKVLVLGMNRRTVAFCRIIKGTKHLGAEIYGYLDEKEIDGSPAKYLGTVDELESIVRRQVIDLAAIFLPIRSQYDVIDSIIETCGFYGVPSCIFGNVFEADIARRLPTCVNDFGNMAYSTAPTDYAGLACKRLFDIASSFCALAALSPLLLTVALYIKIVSRGPVFFRQQRIGLNKRNFRMIKFRTMIPGADKMQDQLAAMNEMDGAAFKITNDPRLIPGGAFLRRHSIDELPQLWNVLRGEMSVVGPRPLSRRDYDQLEADWQRRRFSMRPGLTCIWQVSPSRNDVSFLEWMRMDLDYIDEWSLWLDFSLILKTVKTVLVGSGK